MRYRLNYWIAIPMAVLFLALITFSCEPAYPAEFRVKVGYSDVTCDYVQQGFDLTIGGEYKWGRVALEKELGLEVHKINQVGQLIMLKGTLLLKWYALPDMWIGGGLGYLNNYCIESYDLEADVDSEIAYLITAGRDIGDWFVEVQGRLADLDLESNLPYEAELEKHSRLDSVMFKIGRRF